MKRILLDYNEDEIAKLLEGQPRFRTKQVYSWLHKGKDFSEMKNIPTTLRQKLSDEYVAKPIVDIVALQSKQDDTVKFLYTFMDGNIIEGVLMHYHYGYTLCVSTQIGCRMGCTFCASTLGGCVRNLTAGEMMAQVLYANEYITNIINKEGKVGHIVLMGCGEPLDNYEQTMKFLRMVNHPDGLHISLRNISVSTCGLANKIIELANEKLPVTLSVSLHAPNDEIRRTMMPIANRYHMPELMDAVRYYVKTTGRRVVFEYALVEGVNCETGHAKALAKLISGLQCHVNLIPLNPVKERKLSSASKKKVETFLSELTRLHVSATVRREMGTDIAGACGQLRRKVLEKEAEENVEFN